MDWRGHLANQSSITCMSTSNVSLQEKYNTIIALADGSLFEQAFAKWLENSCVILETHSST